MSNYSYNENYLRIGKFQSSAGLELTEYYDFIQLLIDSDEIDDRIIPKIYDFLPLNLIGVETFGLAITTHLNGKLNYNINPILVLKERRHSNRKRVYGLININFPTYFIDDVITTGKTVKESIELFNFVDIEGILCMLNRSNLKEINGIKIVEL